MDRQACECSCSIASCCFLSVSLQHSGAKHGKWRHNADVLVLMLGWWCFCCRRQWYRRHKAGCVGAHAGLAGGGGIGGKMLMCWCFKC